MTMTFKDDGEVEMNMVKCVEDLSQEFPIKFKWRPK